MGKGPRASQAFYEKFITQYVTPQYKGVWKL